MSTPIKTRVDFRQLAEVRLAEAKVLLDLGMWDGAYYLAGYAVELGLKACIIKALMATDAFPERKFSENCYTHEVGKLAIVAGLKPDLDAVTAADPALLKHWGVANAWSEQKRYHRITAGRGAGAVRRGRRRRTRGIPMDQNALVNDELDSGRQLVEELCRTGYEVAAAFWAKSSDEGSWYLYIASPVVDEKGAADAYLPVHAALRRLPELGIDFFDVRVVAPSDSMAAAAIEITRPKVPTGSFAVQNPKPYRGITRFGGTSLGGVSIDGAYIYPPAQPVTTP